MFLKLRQSILALARMTALRQALGLTLVFLVVVLVAGITAILLVGRELDARIDAELLDRHREMSARIDASEFKPEPFSRSANRFEFLQDATEGTTAGHPFSHWPDAQGFSELDLSIEDDGPDSEWRTYAAPVTGGILIVGSNFGDRNDYVEVLFNVFAITGLLILGSTLLGGLYFGLRAQQRISNISATLGLVAEGDLSARIGSSGAGDDFDQLSRAIDQTTERLEGTMRQIRNLTANIAHDLKTPMARLRGQLEVLERHPGDHDSLEKAQEQADRIIAMFEALLRIAQLESNQHRNHFELLDLGELAQEIADIYGAVIEDSGRVFNLEISKPERVKGDRALLTQAIANLIENSLKHTSENTEVTLTAEGTSIGLKDTGPGIPPNQHDRIFEPMYRLETSRTTSGSGLGLALVKTIATLHQAKLIVTDNPHPGANSPGLKIGMQIS